MRPIRLSVIVLAALYQPSVALADDCDAVVAALVARVGVSAGQRTAAGQIPLKHPLASEVAVECPIAPAIPIDLYLNWNGAFPPSTFFKFAGEAGQIVTGAPAKVFESGAMRCQQAALRSRSEFATITYNRVAFECQAFTRDGGGTAVTLYRK